MEGTLDRTCLILALLGLLLAVSQSVNPGARANGATVAAQAAAMQLQGNPEADESAPIPDEAEKVMERCEQDDPPRPLKHELAFLLADYPQLAEGKNRMTAHDVATKSKD
jgi:hypothetical protein